MLPGKAPLKRPCGSFTTSRGRSSGCVEPFRLTEPIMLPVAVSPIQILPFSPPERYTSLLSDEKVTPMKLALTSIRLTIGVGLSSWVIKVREKGPAPLLSVASILPSGDKARPKGLGALTFTSVPVGVSNRPFGKIAALRPSMMVSVVAGRSPAGAEKVRKFELRVADEPRSASAAQGAEANMPSTSTPLIKAAIAVYRKQYVIYIVSSSSSLRL